ncbi:MAG: EAL domain-containing protein [Nitrincola lacisaponensis]|uniref:bifunctional diguanylate cyclase/phosphodiesterase n=1 Tax=Nitrincola lacisaponensis TaxID=267850 RepID=UPI00391D2AC1
MSLIRQLWIAVVLMMSIAFISSFSISTYKAKAYFEEQLLLKNIDNAGSLALTLSQIEKDPVMLELLIAAQFDTGHYQRIELLDPEGQPLQQKIYQGEDPSGVPQWFQRIAALDIEPGVAQVQDGWFQYGTLYVESHTRFAYQALWTTTRDLLLWFLLVALAAGSLGTLILKLITRPLDDVVQQAEAIGGRRFILSREPRTLEFGRVVKAMNILSDRIRLMLDSERKRLEEMRYKNQHDALTGLANREYFFTQLDTRLDSDDQDSQHALVLIRVRHLATLNQQLGHRQTDALLTGVAEAIQATLQELPDKFTQADAGRLNGSDFALLLTDASDLAAVSEGLLHNLVALSAQYEQGPQLPLAASYFSPADNRASLMMKLDTLLAQAEQREMTCSEITLATQSTLRFHNADEWRMVLTEALMRERVRAEHYPVVALDGSLIHREVMMRMELQGQLHTAGFFIPWARRLGMLPELDVAMVAYQLKQLRDRSITGPLAINLSAETLADLIAVNRLQSELQQAGNLAEQLSFEVSERCVVQHPQVFREFCRQIKPLGCQVGLERAGADFARITNLQELGLDYIKVDHAFVAGLAGNISNQNFLRGLATLGHSIGLQVIADGVREAELRDLLESLGLDAWTGPAVTET